MCVCTKCPGECTWHDMLGKFEGNSIVGSCLPIFMWALRTKLRLAQQTLYWLSQPASLNAEYFYRLSISLDIL